jgi:hypothetical protein
VAQQKLVTLVDDMDGSEPARMVEFALDGVRYQIDLSDDNAERLRGSLAKYVEGARRTGGRLKRPAGTTGPGKRSKVSDPEAPAIRQWAVKHRIPIATAGRIPDDVRAQYRAKVVEEASTRTRKR